MTPEEIAALKKQASDATTALAAKDAEIAKAKKEADMTDAEKAKYNAMTDADAKKNWLDMTHEARAAVLKNDTDSNAVVYKSESTGMEFRKNDDPRLIAMAKASDENAKLAKANQEKFEKADLEKRAGELLAHTPGTIEERAGMLKAVESISDEAVRKKALENLKAADTALSKAFLRKGASGGDDATGGSDAVEKLDAMAKKHAADNKMDYYKAYDAVLKTEEGKALYQETVAPASSARH